MRAVLTTLICLAAAAAPALGQDPDGPGMPVPVVEDIAPEPQVPLRSMPARSAWTEAHIDALAGQLFEAPSHGLPSLDDTAFTLSNPSIALAERVTIAERAFMRFGGWLRFGLVDQDSRETRRLSNAERNILIESLSVALNNGDFAAVFADFAPRVRDYEILRREMIRLTTLQPIWPSIDAGASLSLGDSGMRVDQLRARLVAEGLYPGRWEEGDAFDMRLETAVRRFQGRVNLAPTGRMDQNTLRQLNVQPQARIAQLRANMEQRRWRDRELGRRHIWVNIADFNLEAWEDGALVREHQVMVGSTGSSTPEFSDLMEYLVINPWWGVPTGSAQSRFRSIRRNPNVAAYHGFRVFDASGQAVRPYEIDWSRWGGSWPYRMSQAPGPTNPMGEVKFIFPNRYNVYIHDTTERDQFVRTRRDFSAGCIRVQDPFDLAEWILDGQDGYDRARLNEVAAGNSPDVVWLDEQLPVHIAYWTVVGDSDGEVRYLNDLYRRDSGLISAYMAAFNAFQPDQSEVAAVYESLEAALH